MSTCDTCKWWSKIGPHELGDCQNPMIDIPDDERGMSIFLIGTESYGPILRTGPKFGCVYHEPKT